MKSYILLLSLTVINFLFAPAELVYFKEQSGKDHVQAWIEALPTKDADDIRDILNHLGVNWGKDRSIAKPLKGLDGMFEVKIDTKNSFYRVLFKPVDDKLLILNGFDKKSDKAQGSEMKLAMKRLSQYKEAIHNEMANKKKNKNAK